MKKGHPNANNLGYMQEHRIVMEEHLGRLLDPTEVVHHRNGDKLDNRIDNLQLFTSNGQHLSETMIGLSNGRAVFNSQQVREIRKRSDSGETRMSLAKEFQVSRTTIRKIAERISYTDIKDQ